VRRRFLDLLRRARAVTGLVTPLGWAVVVLAVGGWLVATRFAWREWLVLATTALVLVVLALLFTLGRLDLSASLGVQPSRVTVGERAVGELVLANKRRRGVRGLRVELPVGKATAVFPVAHLRGGESTDELFMVPTERRAVIPVGPVTTVQGDPVGLFRRARQWTGVEEICVHPRTCALTTLTAGLIRDLEGQPTSALSPSDVAFHTLREYVRGDDLRHVHWKSSAKIGELMVRQYNDTRRSHVAVVLSTDTDEYQHEDELELAISCAASVATQALRDDQTLSVIVGGVPLPAVAPTDLLDHFSRIEPGAGRGGTVEAIQALRRLAADASVAVVCTGSRLGIPEIRTATTRAGITTTTIVLRAADGAEPTYRVLGNNRFLDVAHLETLDRGLRAVLA
jgi:uncharacterized protein (DUF58 family)